MLLIVFTSLYLDANNQNNSSYLAENNNFKKFEFGFLSGYGLPQFDFKNSFSDSYSDYWYDVSYYTDYYTEYDINIAYSSSVSGKSEGKFTFGGFLNYFFSKNFGFQFMLESANYDIPVEASHSVDLSFYFYWGENENYTANPNIENTKGSLSVMPISFNLITKFFIGDIVSGYASGGLTYYQVGFEAESRGGTGLIYYWYQNSSDLWFLDGDSVLIPIYIDDSYKGTGGNVGVGFAFQIHENFGIVADFRYYLAPKEKFTWIPMAGNYKKVLFEEYGWSFSSNTLSISQEAINTFLEENERFLQMEVDPSYYRFSIGLKFGF